MFLNLSNHASKNWSEDQRAAAMEYGEIRDFAFPAVDPCASEAEISSIAEKVVDEVAHLSPDCIMCSGEFTLTYALVNRLKSKVYKVVSACSERVVKEWTDADGNTKKEATFRFVRFREYQ